MDSLNFQEIIPLSVWAFSSAVGVMVILIAMFLYIYYRKRLQAVVGDGSNAAELAGRVEQLRKDEDAIRDWLTGQKDELQNVSAERNEQEIIRAELQRLEQECARNEEFNRSLRDEVGSFENKKHLLSEKCQKLEQEISDSGKYIEQLQSKKATLVQSIDQSISEANEREKECNRLTALQEQKSSELRGLEHGLREVKNEVESLRYEYDTLRKKVETLRERETEIDLMNQKMLQLKQVLDETRNEVAIQQRFEDEAARKVKGYSIDIQNLQNKISDFEKQIQDLDSQIKNKINEFGNVDRQVGEVKELLRSKRDALVEIERTLAGKQDIEKQIVSKIQESREAVEKLKSEETSLNASIATLKVLAKKYNKSLGVDEGVDGGTKYRDLWHPVTFPVLTPASSMPSEQVMLRNTSDYIKSQNLYFPERVLNAFHTALKVNDISPLVVLAGISGTGKSELPRRYAEGMGIHSVILAVQPRWDSPQDLFGFYNYLEERYKATELARAMVQFEQFNRPQWPLPEGWKHDRSDRMLLVLLDEMNLARVEYYFSEFLSRLETRRGIDLTNPEERAKAEISLEMGSLAEGEKPIRLFPGQNVLFSGTMNEDETTQALSDKVLDRSCVLRFGRPKRISAQEIMRPIPQTKAGLTFEQWKTFLKTDLLSQDKDRVNGWINKLNDAMEQLDRPFGHRVAQAIQRYIANYPSWIPNRINLAMADQIEQRIMPKLRGIEIGQAAQPLKEIQSVISECGDQDLFQAFKKGAESEEKGFIWRGLDRSEEYN
ncbi:hypothetical protein FCL47_08780 [Desulfopila sp. IMCC35006]|uniref:hypothetical protein n=1 Tax=Desulfopila sp. IMCC35006 TaxID=2569542 RepID=UPI0010AD7D3A|nr:hypothetical protein [Desulfopila sp. IMCC35006]TKB26498.1 hypothetical protein FCL47_08780 [Desulfopila sp. IMCC35006]